MRKPTGLVAGLFLLGAVSACHTDPFSTKPEVNVKLPAKKDPAEDGAEDTGEESPSQP